MTDDDPKGRQVAYTAIGIWQRRQPRGTSEQQRLAKLEVGTLRLLLESQIKGRFSDGAFRENVERAEDGAPEVEHPAPVPGEADANRSWVELGAVRSRDVAQVDRSQQLSVPVPQAHPPAEIL